MTSWPQDLSGHTFGRLSVLRLASGRQWECLCECGNTTVVHRSSLTGGRTRSCGCLRREATAQARRKHGHSGGNGRASAEYETWCAMHQRCRNPRHASHADYAGRGIVVCERWGSFEAFLADMGPRPSPLHTIERRNNDLGYSPENCAWATRGEQAWNKRTSLTIDTPLGPMSVRDAARVSGLSPKVLRRRAGLGWPGVKMFNPLRKPA